jgi:putative aldouronate transport system substrate-binding protein
MKLKWSLIVTSIVFFLGSSLAGCSNKDKIKNGGNSLTESGNRNIEEITIVDGRITPSVTITTVLAELPNTKFREGESISDNVHTRWAKEHLGINFEVLWHSPRVDRSYEERIKLVIAAGEELPDTFISLDEQLIEMLVESDLVLDVGEAFERYASETYKAAMAEISPQGWWPFTREDKKYAIPIIHEFQGTQPVMWIRQDWLDEFGIEAPTTIEELEALMHVFATQDPDGNGINDTIPLALAANPDFSANPIGNPSWVFGMFGAVPDRWYPGEDGRLTFGSVQPGVKDALMKLREWKKKGYISEELALDNFNTLTAQILSDKVGIIGGPNWLNTYSTSILQSNPGVIYKPYPLPEGVDGKIMRTVDNPYLGGIFINKNISEGALRAFFHYQNTLFSIYESENPFLFKDFQEGYDYVIQDGKALTSNEVIPGGRALTAKYMLTGSPPIYNSKRVEASLKYARGEKLTTQEYAALAGNGDLGMGPLELISREAIKIASEQAFADIPEFFQGPTTPTMSRRSEMLKKMEMETFIDIIYGKKPIEAFDDFVENWYSRGGDEVTKEVNKWYDTVK